MKSANILFIVTGSIAAYKACEVISRLVQRGHAVRAVASEAALRFVGPATLEGLTGRPVLSDLFAPGAALEHINLTRWADATIICPATANTLNRIGAGLADDLIGALFLAHEKTKPLLIAPAMNPAMWSHPATVQSVERLRAWGAQMLPVGEGRTACGETGDGRLIEPEKILAAIERVLVPTARRLKVLITSGGTAESIDAVRVLTNTSTGQTGALIADAFARAGHEVVLLRARTSVQADAALTEETFFTFAELDQALERRLGGEDFDVVIHAAAVSDFAVDAVVVAGREHPPGEVKLSSEHPPLLRLRSNRKLLDSLRGRSRNPAVKVVAFKLTSGADKATADAAVASLFANGQADLVVHNDATKRLDAKVFPSRIVRPDGGVAAHCATRPELAETLERLLASASS